MSNGSQSNPDYRIAEGVLARSVGETLVLFHPETERLVTLNRTGTRIWECLSEGDDPEAIIRRLIPFLAAGLQAPLPESDCRRIRKTFGAMGRKAA